MHYNYLCKNSTLHNDNKVRHLSHIVFQKLCHYYNDYQIIVSIDQDSCLNY